MNNQESLERKLRELILDIQNCNPVAQRSERRKKLHQLFILLDRNFLAYKPKRRQVPDSFSGAYEEICHEAKSLLWKLLHEMIANDKYDPERGPAIAWIRFYMNRRCVPQAIQNIIGKPQEISVDTIEEFLPDSSLPSRVPSEQVKEVLILDPSGEFKSTHVQGNPAANFQVLALRVYEQKSWNDLAQELDEKVSVLSCFFQRWLKRKFAAYIRSYIQENF